jgi:hypothetical protein
MEGFLMNKTSATVSDARDLLLTDVAIRIQLPPSRYRLAVTRIATLSEWIDREASPLRDHVKLMYAQGSMAINATIGSCLRNDEFDIDVIAQLDLAPGVIPKAVLDLLYEAIRGEPGSRYHGMTTRKTRCVTIEYGDMHVDITPAQRLPGREDRVSHIFHHRTEEPVSPGKRVIANPYGFANWFNQHTQGDPDFTTFFEQRSRARDSRTLLEKAAAEDVPDQLPAYLKSPRLIALQLIKRFRNVRYDKRPGRRVPSIILSQLVATGTSDMAPPFTELLLQARRLLAFFEASHSTRSLIRVVNPACSEDVFTDRWPETLAAQDIFLDDLRLLVRNLSRLELDADLKVIGDVYSALFGEEPTRSVIKEFADRAGASIDAGHIHAIDSRGQVDLGRSGLLAIGTSAKTTKVERTTPRHTFYGPAD